MAHIAGSLQEPHRYLKLRRNLNVPLKSGVMCIQILLSHTLLMRVGYYSIII